MMRPFFAAVWRGSAPVVIGMLLICRGGSGEPTRDVASGQLPAERLVRSALESELAGCNDQRTTLLRQALEQSPDNGPAHWQMGQVRVKDDWVSPGEVEQAARQDPRLAQYRRLRETAGPTVDDQIALARWCRKNKLVDEERVHWLFVCQLQPGHPEAIKALGLHPYQGMLLTNDQIAQLKEQTQTLSKAIERWRPLVARWRRAVESHEPSPPTEVREKVAKIWDSMEMLGLQRALSQQVGAKKEHYHRMSLELIRALAENPHPTAAQCLTWLAVLSEYEDVRSAAVAGLKRHPLDHYAPLLVSGLRSPLEAAMQCTVDAGNHLITRYSVCQEGPLADVSFSQTVSPVVTTDPPRIADTPVGAGSATSHQSEEERLTWRRNELAAVELRRRQNMMRSGQQAARNSAALRSSVDTANRTIEQNNARIVEVLSQATDLNLGTEPREWRKWWWQDHNDAFTLDTREAGAADDDSYEPGVGPHKPVVEYADTLAYNVTPTPHSCFAPGTKVWTLTGLLPIEQIKAGDRVLAQDVESGELAYKPVLGVTIRKPVPRMKIGLGTETITTTLGHPFWVVGKGWQLTRQVEVGTSLHTLSGGQPVETIEKAEAVSSANGFSHNLIVADFNTYFVGDRGILVHDNTPRKPTAALLPGFGQRQGGATKKERSPAGKSEGNPPVAE